MSNDPQKMLQCLRGKSAKTAKWASESQKDGHWHENLLKVTLNLVRQGKTDAEIHDLTDNLTTEGFRVHDTRKEVQKMVDGARKLIPANEIEAEREIENLSQVGDVSYQLQRKDVAKRLGMTVGALDVVEPVSPWPEPINAIKMADYIEQTINRHIALKKPEYATAVTLSSLSKRYVQGLICAAISQQVHSFV